MEEFNKMKHELEMKLVSQQKLLEMYQELTLTKLELTNDQLLVKRQNCEYVLGLSETIVKSTPVNTPFEGFLAQAIDFDRKDLSEWYQSLLATSL